MSSIDPSQPHPSPRGPLHIILWVVQVLLAILFLLAGYTHAIVPIEQAAASAPWIADVPAALARFIGVAELAGAIGLVVPAATRIAPRLTPLAAVGLGLVMVLAAPFHLMRAEVSVVPINLVIGALAFFVAWGRYRKAPIPARG